MGLWYFPKEGSEDYKMIRVVMIDSKPAEIYKAATKFKINSANGNLHVSNDTGEDVAVHVHGTWASVSVDNTRNYVDKLTPEMVSGEWPTVFDDSSTYDCSGTNFVNKVTNFCVANVANALSACRLSQRREDITLLVDISLFNRLEDSYQLNRKPDGTTWHRFKIEISPTEQDLRRGFLDTLIRHSSGKVIKLITREF